jgi:hypothetical protein
MVGSAIASEEDELQKMQDYINNTDSSKVVSTEDNGDSVRVISNTGKDITDSNHISSDTDSNNNDGINPDDIYSDKKVLGQDVKEGSFLDFINLKKWISLIFVNGYVSAVAGLVFAVVGLVIIFGSGLSILKNGASMALAMLSLDGDVDEKVEKVRDSEKSTITLIRGLGVTFLAMSLFCFMINFLS